MRTNGPVGSSKLFFLAGPFPFELLPLLFYVCASNIHFSLIVDVAVSSNGRRRSHPDPSSEQAGEKERDEESERKARRKLYRSLLITLISRQFATYPALNLAFCPSILHVSCPTAKCPMGASNVEVTSCRLVNNAQVVDHLERAP